MKISKHLDSDKQHLNGTEVEVVQVVLEETDGFDSEVLPMAWVKPVGSEERLLVFPEELDSPLPLPEGYVPPRDRIEA